MIESTGVVVTPYMEYPQLLGMLLQMLSEGSPQARLEVLKVCPGHALGGVWGCIWGPRLFEVALGGPEVGPGWTRGGSGVDLGCAWVKSGPE